MKNTTISVAVSVGDTTTTVSVEVIERDAPSLEQVIASLPVVTPVVKQPAHKVGDDGPEIMLFREPAPLRPHRGLTDLQRMHRNMRGH